MNFENIIYRKLEEDCLFICVVGYEPRSAYLLEENINSRTPENTLILKLESKFPNDTIEKKLAERNLNSVAFQYNDTESYKREVSNFLRPRLNDDQKITLCIDYSSMPRSWYCSTPFFLREFAGEKLLVDFFYTAGNYPYKYENYPTAGIENISVFSGSTLPAVDINRYHIMGLCYDKIRTETVKSIVEPDRLITCYAYNPSDNSTRNNVYRLNETIINDSLFSVALPINNFVGMVDKLSEIVYDQIRENHSILIPDGPKPLIMAMSIIPDRIGRNGVTCLHISRNSKHYSKIQVVPRINEVYGFRMTNV